MRIRCFHDFYSVRFKTLLIQRLLKSLSTVSFCVSQSETTDAVHDKKHYREKGMCMSLKTRYYFIGSLICFLGANLIGFFVFYSFGGTNQGVKFFNFYLTFNGLIPILVATSACCGISYAVDKKYGPPAALFIALVNPLIIMISSVIIGCMTNYLINTDFSDFFAWFVKPLYWISFFGVPASIISSFLYWLVYKRKYLQQ